MDLAQWNCISASVGYSTLQCTKGTENKWITNFQYAHFALLEMRGMSGKTRFQERFYCTRSRSQETTMPCQGSIYLPEPQSVTFLLVFLPPLATFPFGSPVAWPQQEGVLNLAVAVAQYLGCCPVIMMMWAQVSSGKGSLDLGSPRF